MHKLTKATAISPKTKAAVAERDSVDGWPCCWLCGKNGAADPLDKHHIFGGPFRKKSEKYGLKVPLCHYNCHIFGAEAVHKNKDTMQLLHEYGQRKVMAEQGWTVERFIKEFGKSYL